MGSGVGVLRAGTSRARGFTKVLFGATLSQASSSVLSSGYIYGVLFMKGAERAVLCKENPGVQPARLSFEGPRSDFGHFGITEGIFKAGEAHTRTHRRENDC